MNEFAKQLLESHNRFRDLHQAPPLAYDQALAAAAQKWADSLAERDSLKSDISCRKEMGENVAMKFSHTRKDFPGKDFSEYWYSSVVDYDFSGDTPVQPGSSVLSFTQLVWKASDRFGVGRAVSKAGRVYVVARYGPGGNCVGQFQANVLPTRDGKLPEFVTKQATAAAAVAAAGDEIVEVTKPEDLKPVIGGRNPDDVLIGATTTTRIEGFMKVVTLVEKYKTPEGNTYTREKQRSYTGAMRK